MSSSKNIGIKVNNAPEQKCNDKKCPFHGSIKLRGRTFVGEVKKKDLGRTATVEWSRVAYLPKYERSEVRKTKIHVHNPQCINAQINDKVKIVETRPLSKTKHFVIVEIIGKEEKKEVVSK
jgi:small subunit ribosomal protein S17